MGQAQQGTFVGMLFNNRSQRFSLPSPAAVKELKTEGTLPRRVRLR